MGLIHGLLMFGYVVFQKIIAFLFAPKYRAYRNPFTHRPLPEIDDEHKTRGHVAVIGAGLTGIATAAHCISYGYEVTIFEQRDFVGGIWARVNETSGLQLSSIAYRPFPSFVWSRGYPKKPEIVSQITKLWHEYKLVKRTRFNYKVDSVRKERGKWIVNDEKQKFDVLFATVGTCGDVIIPPMEGADDFKGPKAHSSELDGFDVKGKDVVIVGSGASGVEAVEHAVDGGAKSVHLLARSDKWIIPRNIVLDAVLSLLPGREFYLGDVMEFLLRKLFYRDLQHIAPYGPKLYASTPCVNSRFLNLIRQGKTIYHKGVVDRIVHDGVYYQPRKGEPDYGVPSFIRADAIIYATGFKKPGFDFLPSGLLDKPFAPPSLYMTFICARDCSLVLTNATYKDAIGSVSNYHIGLFSRVALLFNDRPDLAPTPEEMQHWVRFYQKRKEGLRFLTYGELLSWFVLFFLGGLGPEGGKLGRRVHRLRFAFFVLFGFTIFTPFDYK